MISNAHFWNAGARSYNPICLNPLLVLEKITPLPGSSVYSFILITLLLKNRKVNIFNLSNENILKDILETCIFTTQPPSSSII